MGVMDGMGGMGSHSAAIVGLLYLPILLFVFALAMQAGSLAGVGFAGRFVQGYRKAGPAAHLAALGLAISAMVHLSLAPTHFAEDRVLGVLFAMNGIAMTATVIGIYVTSFWRLPALALVTATLLAYAFYILIGREAVDVVGIFTKAVELSAAVLIVFGDRSDQILGRLTPAHITEASV